MNIAHTNSKKICTLIKFQSFNYNSLISFVRDRKGHDFRYAIIKKN